MAHLDPTKIKVESHAVPIWETEVTFQDMMAEQLRHAPWLILSAALHVVVLLLLWVLVPAKEDKPPAKKVEMANNEQEQVEEPPPPPPPETKPEEVVDPVEVTETTVTETEQAFDNVDSEVTSKESAFDSNQWNSAVGLGGGAGGRYGGRGGGGKGKGGGKALIESIDAGLQWLKNHQDEDGKWDCDGFMKHDVEGEPCDGPGNAVHDVGVTGLALLAFLGDGSTMRAGPYRDVIKKGVQWLRSQQDEKGLFGTNASHDFIYDHAIAAYAMCEAFGLSNYQLLKPTAQKGINYLESHRNPYGVWRYQPRDNDNDTSVTGWCIMAYESGEFFGLQINKEALKYSAIWLDQVSDPTGRHGYLKAGDGGASRKSFGDHKTKFPADKVEPMTAVGLFCRYFMNQDPKEKPIMAAAANLISQKPPVWDEKAGTIDHYYWYYATYALFQVGGKQWTDWQKKLETAVVKNQHRDKSKKNLYGSWDPIDAWGEDGGRVYSTAILVLTLEAYYRYSKLVR
ncbi:MAG: terpene cyclase/mutase family protein [Planctomycetes bacterium]|nr:terpene cyclase/mutase family protein [Planctomycetota bacterium]